MVSYSGEPMPVRVRLALMAAGSVAVLVMAVLLLVGPPRPEASGIASAASPFQGATRAGQPSPDFRLRDENGRVVTLAGLRGRPAILTFLFTTCEDTCPITARQIGAALDDLGNDAPPAYAVSVDPANDDAPKAQRFLTKMGVSDRMHFLLGSRAELSPVWKQYAIQPQGAAFDHSAYVLLIDARGRQRVAFPVDKLTPDGLAADVRVLQREAASGRPAR